MICVLTLLSGYQHGLKDWVAAVFLLLRSIDAIRGPIYQALPLSTRAGKAEEAPCTTFEGDDSAHEGSGSDCKPFPARHCCGRELCVAAVMGLCVGMTQKDLAAQHFQKLPMQQNGLHQVIPFLVQTTELVRVIGPALDAL